MKHEPAGVYASRLTDGHAPAVANVSRFMLQFVYSLQEAFTKIRSFVFVGLRRKRFT